MMRQRFGRRVERAFARLERHNAFERVLTLNEPFSLWTTPLVLLRQHLEVLDPARCRRVPAGPATRWALACVYRRRNAEALERLLLDEQPDSAALWALDEPTPGLARATYGQGPGTRFTLLNRLIAFLGVDEDSWLVVCDDDVEMRDGTLSEAVQLAALCRLDLAQPAHCADSYLNWSSTGRHLGTLVRLNPFVEIGPVTIISPAARQALLPFPEVGMGWGVDAEWALRRDLRSGILDRCTMRHKVPVSRGSYDIDAEWDRLTVVLRAAGVRHITELQADQARWWAWQRTPPWLG